MRQWIVAVTLLFVLSGCSARFVYNWMDWIVPWEVDDYVDLNRSQSKQLDAIIERTLAWHRVNELPQYIDHLDSLTAQLSSPISADHIQQQLDRFGSHWNRLYDHLLPDIIPLVQSLSEKQVAQILSTVQEEEDELRQEYSELSLNERIAKSNTSMRKGMKKRIGRLTAEQKQLIEQYNEARHRSLQQWFSYRDRYMALLRLALTERSNTEALVARLQLLLIDYDQLKSKEHKQLLEYNQQLFIANLAAIHHSLTDKQMKKLISDLTTLRDDFAYLAAKAQ
ncbi:DUF6279 family lipoprotein [uncultured Ferrimonas sp.]|uniref:DUF6279 family lipoprotein n=1 Tax=uncultured Ferrimonas sp. TaxID=432640 RepID=UPI0026132BB6|nr:DUF6279 family lipoprotein [uncultured Ferrimonas sp.]